MDTLCDDVAQVLLELLPIHAKAALRRTSKSWQASIDDGPSAIPTTAALNAAWLALLHQSNDDTTDTTASDTSCDHNCPLSHHPEFPQDALRSVERMERIGDDIGCGYGTPSSSSVLLPDPLGTYLDHLGTKPNASAFSSTSSNPASTGRATTLLLGSCRLPVVEEHSPYPELFLLKKTEEEETTASLEEYWYAKHCQEGPFEKELRIFINDWDDTTQFFSRNFGGLVSSDSRRNGHVVAVGVVRDNEGKYESGVSFLWKEQAQGEDSRRWWCIDVTMIF